MHLIQGSAVLSIPQLLDGSRVQGAGCDAAPSSRCTIDDG
jgi:hypothetical protein